MKVFYLKDTDDDDDDDDEDDKNKKVLSKNIIILKKIKNSIKSHLPFFFLFYKHNVYKYNGAESVTKNLNIC